MVRSDQVLASLAKHQSQLYEYTDQQCEKKSKRKAWHTGRRLLTDKTLSTLV